jgi:hypothetical protein
MRQQLLMDWLKGQQPTIDLIICEAANDFFLHNKSKPYFGHDLIECQSESFNLINNKDLCYDRPCTAFVYSLWYHARRLNTFLYYFTQAITQSNDKVIEIFDLGAGTGAVQFATALVQYGMAKLGFQSPKIRIINIDTSPFMLSYNKEYLWKTFVKYYPAFANNSNFLIEYSVNSWNVKTEQQAINPWLTASYLFDISDNKELIAQDFLKTIEQYKPSTLLLLTSNQPAKVKMLDQVVEQIMSFNYHVQSVQSTATLFSGNLPKVNRFRTELSMKYSGKGLEKLASWDDGSFVGKILQKRELTLNLLVEKPKEISKINLFNPPIKVRKDIELSEQQKKLAIF